MRRFKKILLYDDGRPGSARSLWRAAELARRNEARLAVIGIADRIPGTTQKLFSLVGIPDVQDWGIDDVRKRLKKLAGHSGLSDLTIRVEVAAGTRFLEVIRQVIRGGHDLLMVNAEGGRHSWFGSTVTHLLRKCPCPVWVLRPEPADSYGRILAAVDSAPDGRVGEGLNQQILEIATSLARFQGAELHVATAWSVIGEGAVRSRLGIDPEALVAIRAWAKRECVNRLIEMLEEVDTAGLRLTTHIACGSGSALIPNITRDVNAELIVVGTVGRTGIAGLLIGNTADSIFAQVECPVLAIKPEGFQTPVTLEAV